MENPGDVVGVGDDFEDAHPAAALSADGDVDGEHTGEELGPGDASRGLGLGQLGRHGCGAAGEVERELLAGELGAWAGDDARAQVMVAGEDGSRGSASSRSSWPGTPCHRRGSYTPF